MAKKIQFKRGLKKNLPPLAQGEIAYTTDEKSVYIGEGTENIRLLNQKDKNDFTTQLVETTKKTESIINLAEPKWGIFLDGKTDSTAAFETVLRYATDNGSKILFPKGEIIITRPITIDYAKGKNPPLSFTLEGIGGVAGNNSTNYGSRIRAYNIPDGRGAIELLGLNNRLITSTDISNIEIALDDVSCGELAFCMFIGDAQFFSFRKCRFNGYNSVLLRCGTGRGATSYANMMCKFDQCRFEVRPYVDWDGTTIHEKARFGFALANERMFYENGYTQYMSDSITFDTCFFAGTVVSYITKALYLNCMWCLAGAYKPEIDISKDSRFNLGFFNGLTTIDSSVAFWLAGGYAQMMSPYFEGCFKSVYARALGKQGGSISLDTPSFINSIPYTPHINGEAKGFVYGIKSDNILGGSPYIRMHGGSLAKNNFPFSENFIVNNGFQNVEIRDISNVSETDITDNKSLSKRIKYRDKPNNDSLTVTFKGEFGNMIPLENLDIYEYKICKDYNLVKVEFITSKILQNDHAISIKKDGSIYISFSKIGPSYSSLSYIDKMSGVANEIYTINDIPYINLENYPPSDRRFSFKKGDVIGVTPTVPIADGSVTVKLYFEG